MRKSTSFIATFFVALASMSILRGAEKAASPASKSMSNNPLFTESTLPYHAPPFDKIKDEHYAPAYEKGMAEELKEAEAIAASKDKPTFENTILALERSGELLGRVDRILPPAFKTFV
jgi:peptidyl-dipeptidase Dcp